jgi:hypothetical protein
VPPVDGFEIRHGDARTQGDAVPPIPTTNTVIEYEPDRRIAWETTAVGGLFGGRIWRYELSPVDGGTLVRETWDVSQEKQKSMITSGSMPSLTERGIRATLERIANLLEG